MPLRRRSTGDLRGTVFAPRNHSREIMDMLTAQLRAIDANVSPAARHLIASAR
jgi:hypothetical protein